MKKSAAYVVGRVSPLNKHAHTNDSQVSELVAKGKELRLSLNNNNQFHDRKSVRKDINSLKNKICKRLKDINNDVAKALADEISSTADRKKPPDICVKNDDGVTVGTG